MPGGRAAALALVFAIAFVGTWLARRYALARRLIDQPGVRRSHVVATPRGGGIAIVAAMLAAIGLNAWTQPPLPWGLLAAGLLLVASVGWIDDHRPLSPWSRLAVHAAGAACLAGALLASGAGSATAAVAAVLALVLTNIWNFMDGIDGLAVSQALLVAVGCAWLAPAGATWLPLALVAACAGFLPFNLPPARIFLGDVGSGALGYLLAALVAVQAVRAPDTAVVLLLPLSAFIIDASLTLARRVLRGEHWWLPHTQHAYQRWVQRRGNHGLVTGAYAAWSALMLMNMCIASRGGYAVKMLALAACYVGGAIAWMRLQRTPHPLGDRE